MLIDTVDQIRGPNLEHDVITQLVSNDEGEDRETPSSLLYEPIQEPLHDHSFVELSGHYLDATLDVGHNLMERESER